MLCVLTRSANTVVTTVITIKIRIERQALLLIRIKRSLRNSMCSSEVMRLRASIRACEDDSLRQALIRSLLVVVKQNFVAAFVAGLLLLGEGLLELAHHLAGLGGELAGGREAEVFLVFGEGVLGMAGTQEDVAGDEVRLGEVGFELECATDLGACAHDVALLEVDAAQCEVAWRGLVVEGEAL